MLLWAPSQGSDQGSLQPLNEEPPLGVFCVWEAEAEGLKADPGRGQCPNFPTSVIQDLQTGAD